MHATSIRHADLVVDFDASGWVQVTRQSTGHSIQLSQSEWIFLLKVADLRGWPVAPPAPVAALTAATFGTDPPGSG
jgi:hypothetical protein